MARWRLMVSHYVNTVQSVEWEYTATQAGRTIRKRIVVPRYLDINDPSDWTIKIGTGTPVAYGGNDDGAAGIVVVCYPGKGEPSDIAITGDPTPDMMPLDDEAKEISAQFTDRWSYKPDTAEIPFAQTMFDKLEELRTTAEPQPSGPVVVEGLDQILATMAATQRMMAELVATTSASNVRRI